MERLHPDDIGAIADAVASRLQNEKPTKTTLTPQRRLEIRMLAAQVANKRRKKHGKG